MEKGDVFAIGMIMLEFCSLEPSSECYDPETYNILDEIVQERLFKISKIYNPLLAQCFGMMLQGDVNQRPGPIELSYMIHAKIRQNKMEINENSRISQNSRIAMNMPQRMVNTMGPMGPIDHQGLPPNVRPHF